LCKSDRLEAQIVLVAPEPGQGRVMCLVPAKAARDNLGLFGGILYGFETNELSISQKRCAVSYRENAIVRCQTSGVRHDAAIDLEPSGLRQRCMRNCADRTEYDIGGEALAIGKCHLEALVCLRNERDKAFKAERYPVPFVSALNDGRQLRAGHPGEHAV